MNLNCIIEIQCFLGGGGTPLLCHLTGYGFQGLASNAPINVKPEGGDLGHMWGI